MHANFISFHDLSSDGRYQYVSPSVTTLLGYEPSEVVGRPAYDFFRDDEIPACRALHAQTIAQEKVAVVVHCHMRHKDGHFIKVSIVSNLTSGGIVASTCRASENEILRAREITGQELHFIETNGVVVSKSWTKSTSSATPAGPPAIAATSEVSEPVPTAEPTAKSPSPESWDAAVAAISDTRTCLLIDRFTSSLNVVFASPNVSDVFGPSDASSPAWIVGRSLLDFVDPSARDRVQEEIAKAKAMDGICHLRFRTTLASASASNSDASKARVVDMVLMCTADALIAIARQALTHPSLPSAAIPHMGDEAESIRSWNRRSTVSLSTLHTSAPGSPGPHPPPAAPVYAPGKGLVILTHNEPKYLDFAPPLALLPALGDFDVNADEEEDEDDDIDDEEDSMSYVSYAASGVSNTSSALYAPSSVWAQQSSASTDSEDVDVYVRGVNGVIDVDFKLAGESPHVHQQQQQQQQQRHVYRAPPSQKQRPPEYPPHEQPGRYPHAAPLSGFPLPSSYQQHHQHHQHHQPRQHYPNLLPRGSRPGVYRHHPYRPPHAQAQAHRGIQHPRASSTFYAYSTPAGSLDHCVELNFFHQHQQHAYPSGYPHHQYASQAHPQAYAAHHPPPESGQEYGWAGTSHPQARVFRYRDASALDAAYGMGKGGTSLEGGDGSSSVDGQVG